MKLDDYEQTLLGGWEDTYKKSQLTLWVLLALKDGKKHMASIKDFIEAASDGHLTADDKSMYRALRRFDEASLVSYTEADSANGPKRKVYQLTESGLNVLGAFIERNITDILLHPRNVGLFNE